MLLVLLISFISASGFETVEQENALQMLREGNFDIILDIRSRQDFESLRLDGAFHLGSLMHRRHHHGRHHGHHDSESSSDSSEDEHRERPPLEAHAHRLHGCENSRIAVHHMGSGEDSEMPFSTAEVAYVLSELGFTNVFDLGDVSVAANHDDIATTSGERSGKCRPECAVHHRPHGHHGRGEGPDDAMAMGSTSRGHPMDRNHRSWGRHRSDSSSSDDSKSVATSFVKFFGLTISGFVLLSVLICFYRRCLAKPDLAVITEPPAADALPTSVQTGSKVEGSTYVLSVNDPETGSPIETINGSPEGWGEDTTNADLPPTFEEVEKAAQLEKQHSTLAE